MYSINEYDKLLIMASKKLSSKKYEGQYKELLYDLKELEQSILKYNEKEMSFSTIMYQVRYLKNLYSDILKDTILAYQEVVLPDFSYKGDVLSCITSPFSLKVWMLRFMCLTIINKNLSLIIKEPLKEKSMTNKYYEIDSILCEMALKNKVTN